MPASVGSSLIALTVPLFDKALGEKCVNLLTRTNLHYELRLEGAGRESFHNVQRLASGSLGKHLKQEVRSQSCCHRSKSASDVGTV